MLQIGSSINPFVRYYKGHFFFLNKDCKKKCFPFINAEAILEIPS